MDIFKKGLSAKAAELSLGDFEEIAASTEQYSGADVAAVAKCIMERAQKAVFNTAAFRSVTREGKAVLEPCKENAEGALKCSAHDIVKQGRSHEAVTPCLTTQMVRDALQVIKPSPQPSMEYYQAWTKLYGSSGK